MEAGAAQIVITPPAGTPTLGTIQRSTGVHDELYAKALILTDATERIAILSLDLIGTDFTLADEIRDAIRKRSGIKVALIHCTHNHSAPFTIPWSVLGPRWFEGPGATWRSGLAFRLAELVAKAAANSETVTLRAGRAPVHIGTNRRLPSEHGVVMKPNPAGPVVPWVDVLAVDRIDGSPLAILLSHAAHPVIIHGASREISAEYPGFATLNLARRLGGNVVTMFGQAFAANINGDPLRGGVAAAKHAGEVLAEAAFQALSDSEPLSTDKLKVTSLSWSIALQPLPSRRECLRLIEEAEGHLANQYGKLEFTDEQLWDLQDEGESARIQSESSGVDDVQPMEGKPWWIADTILCLRDLLSKIDKRDESPLRFDAQLIRLGDQWSLLATTHELFSEYQLLLDKLAPAKHNMMLAYTNGCESYIPLDKDLASGGYEASTFPEDGAALRYRHRRAVRPGFEQALIAQLRSLWS